MGTAVAAYLGWVTVVSAVCYAAYGFDKRRAAAGGRRVPERTLHLLALAGGWPGGVLGRRRFRHKTRKVPFLVTSWLMAALHLVAVAGLAYGSTAVRF